MKFLRYGPRGAGKPGLLDDAVQIRDPSHLVEDIPGDALTDLGCIAGLDFAAMRLVPGNPRFGACFGRTGKFMCIGLITRITRPKAVCPCRPSGSGS